MSGTTNAPMGWVNPGSMNNSSGMHFNVAGPDGMARQGSAYTYTPPPTNQTTYRPATTDANGAFSGYADPQTMQGIQGATRPVDARGMLQQLGYRPGPEGSYVQGKVETNGLNRMPTVYGANGQVMDMSGGVPPEWITYLQQQAQAQQAAGKSGAAGFNQMVGLLGGRPTR